jgi:hypothetical protein
MVVPQWLVQLLLRHQLLDSRPAVPDPHIEARILHDREHHLRATGHGKSRTGEQEGCPRAGSRSEDRPLLGKEGGTRAEAGAGGGAGRGQARRGGAAYHVDAVHVLVAAPDTDHCTHT